MNQAKNNAEYDAGNLFFFILKWRKQLFIVAFAAAIISAAVSLFIKDKYLSTVILFPASTSSISKSVMTEDPVGKNDIVAFGEEEQAEQMLQILYSDEIRNYIVGKYDLMNHWKIPADAKYKITKLNKMYEDNITFKRTEFLSIRIDVLDYSPDTAALIANDIAEKVDEVKNRMQQERAKKALKVIEQEYFAFMQHMKNVQDSLTALRKLGIHDVEVQIEALSAQYYKALASGDSKSIRLLEEKLEAFENYGSAFISMSENQEYEHERMILLRSKYEEIKVDATENIPHKFVVNNAYPSEKKAYPIRWLIVVVSVIASLVLAVLVIISVENIGKYNLATSKKS